MILFVTKIRIDMAMSDAARQMMIKMASHVVTITATSALRDYELMRRRLPHACCYTRASRRAGTSATTPLLLFTPPTHAADIYDATPVLLYAADAVYIGCLSIFHACSFVTPRVGLFRPRRFVTCR